MQLGSFGGAISGACFSVAAFLGGAAAGAAPAALIFDVMGSVEPAVPPLSEIEAGTVLRLAPGSEMFLIHYASCTEAHLKGGSVTVGAATLDLGDGAEMLGSTAIECPTKVAFAEAAGETASVVMRGDGGALGINAYPHFVIVGGGVTQVRILKDGVEAASMPVSGGLARPAEGAAALPAGAGYEVVFETAEGPRRAKAAVVAGAGATIVSR